MSILELVLKFRRKLVAFFLDFSIGCPTSFVYTLQAFFGAMALCDWQFDHWWCVFFLLSPFKSSALGYGLVISHYDFLCDFSDELKSLGWMWGVWWVWASSRNLMAAKYCLNVSMENTGILVIRCYPKLSMCILLPQFQLLLITLFGWLTFWLMKRLLGPMMATLLQEQKEIILNLFRLICKAAWLAEQYFSSLLKSNFCYAQSFSYFFLVTKFVCWICSLHILKERKRKRFLLLNMLVVLLVPSWRPILIFQHDSMMWWILMECIVPCLWLGQSTYQMFLGLIRYVLEYSVLCLYFFLTGWVALNLLELCFRLMWIWWKKACGWLEACSHWLALSPPNMWSMILTGYAMLLSVYLWLEFCLIVTLTFDFVDFSGTLNGNYWLYQESLELENRQYDPRFFASQEGNTEGGSSRGGSRRSSHRRTQSPNDAWLVFLFFLQNKRKCSLDNLVLFTMFSSLSLASPWIM